MSEQKFDINQPIQVGGQAVIEGVMMRAKGMIATAVRRANGEIVVKKMPFTSGWRNILPSTNRSSAARLV